MKWYVKLTAQKFVSFYQAVYGVLLIRGSQNILGCRRRKYRMVKIKSEIDRGLAVAFLDTEHRKEFSSFRILELGSGWHGSDLILFLSSRMRSHYDCGCDWVIRLTISC